MSTAPPSEGVDKLGFDRLVFFSDAVMAIAITVLVLELHVPDLSLDQTEHELLARLLDLSPRFFGYLISFVVIGLYWLGHHRLFRYIRRYDTGLLLLNLLFLLTVAFLPFPTAVLSAYEYNRVAVVFYTLSLSACGVVLGLLWWYATAGRRLVDASLDQGMVRYLGLRTLWPLTAYLVALAISLINPRLAVSLLLVLLACTVLTSLALDRRYLKRHPQNKV
jgi:uncharacterized membrane protein